MARTSGWNAALAPDAPVSAASQRRPDEARVEAARLLDFRCRRLAGLDVLDAAPTARVSRLGGEIARGIARAEGLALA
jgi:hypothetical protein